MIFFAPAYRLPTSIETSPPRAVPSSSVLMVLLTFSSPKWGKNRISGNPQILMKKQIFRVAKVRISRGKRHFKTKFELERVFAPPRGTPMPPHGGVPPYEPHRQLDPRCGVSAELKFQNTPPAKSRPDNALFLKHRPARRHPLEARRDDQAHRSVTCLA